MNYFIEYEFKTQLDNYYWFPIYYTTNSKNEVERFHQSVIDSIRDQQHLLIRCTKPQPVIDGINSDYLKDYTQRRMRGRVGKIEVDEWEFTAQTDETTSFQSNLNSVQIENLCDKTWVAKRISHKEFTIFCYKSNPFELDEFLLLNIIDPTE